MSQRRLVFYTSTHFATSQTAGRERDPLISRGHVRSEAPPDNQIQSTRADYGFWTERNKLHRLMQHRLEKARRELGRYWVAKQFVRRSSWARLVERGGVGKEEHVAARGCSHR